MGIIELDELDTLVAKREVYVKEKGMKSKLPPFTQFNNVKASSKVRQERKCTIFSKTGRTEAICSTNKICKHCSMKGWKETPCWQKHRYPPSMALAKKGQGEYPINSSSSNKSCNSPTVRSIRTRVNNSSSHQISPAIQCPNIRKKGRLGHIYTVEQLKWRP